MSTHAARPEEVRAAVGAVARLPVRRSTFVVIREWRESGCSRMGSEDRSECEHSLMTEISIELIRWTGPWSDDDPDAQLQGGCGAVHDARSARDAASTQRGNRDPCRSARSLRAGGWASAGSESLLNAGPSIIERMWATFSEAEQTDTSEARLAAYEVVRQMVAWLRAPLDT